MSFNLVKAVGLVAWFPVVLRAQIIVPDLVSMPSAVTFEAEPTHSPAEISSSPVLPKPWIQWDEVKLREDPDSGFGHFKRGFSTYPEDSETVSVEKREAHPEPEPRGGGGVGSGSSSSSAGGARGSSFAGSSPSSGKSSGGSKGSSSGSSKGTTNKAAGKAADSAPKAGNKAANQAAKNAAKQKGKESHSHGAGAASPASECSAGPRLSLSLLVGVPILAILAIMVV